MTQIRKELRAPRPQGQFVSDLFTSVLQLQEMKTSRGSRYRELGFYQIRMKPIGESTELLDKIKIIASNSGATFIKVNQLSPCSSKFPSVSFQLNEIKYDVVLARGANKGESFEKHLLNQLILFTKEHKTSIAKKALDAIATADPSFNISHLQSVKARTGKTHRSSTAIFEETGAIIADIILELKDGRQKFISVKNSTGSTIGQFGIAKAFKKDLTIDVESDEWKYWLKPFNLCPDRISKGLQSYKQEHFEDVIEAHPEINDLDQIKANIAMLWGCGYIYLREHRDDFKAELIDIAFLDNVVLKDLKVTEIRYPSNKRKQISIYLESSSMRFKLEVRNPDGIETRPTQIQLSLLKSKDKPSHH